MVTGYEVDMYRDITMIRRNVERIATALEQLVEVVTDQMKVNAEEDPSDESH